MEENIDHIDELIGKYLAGETSETERGKLKNWIAEKAENKHYFDHLKEIFDRTSSFGTWQHFDTDRAWNSVKEKIKPQGKQVDMKSPFTVSWWIKIAASLLILAVVSYGLYQWDGNRSTEELFVVASSTAVVSDTLPDGSTAFLNKESKIAYSYDSRLQKRKVQLEGEAYFDVVHDENEPFVIEVDNLIIEDIGTTFNVKAYPDSSTVEVLVETGEVAFYAQDQQGVRLQKGEMGIYYRETKEFKKVIEQGTNTLSYKSHHFVFDDADLSFIVASLNAVYDKPVRLKHEGLQHCSINVSFQGESVRVICDIIAETLGLTVIETESEIILDGTGCDE